MRRLWEVTDFVRAMRREMRFGEISRAPLRLLRLEWRHDAVDCDWIARPADDWDSGLLPALGQQNASRQALADAITVRNLVFDALPRIDCAVLRAFRQPIGELPEMILLGTVSREIPEVHRVSSLVMRAKLFGFCFNLEGGVLKPLHLGDRAEEFISQRADPAGSRRI